MRKIVILLSLLVLGACFSVDPREDEATSAVGEVSEALTITCWNGQFCSLCCGDNYCCVSCSGKATVCNQN